MESHKQSKNSFKRELGLTLGALGVVFRRYRHLALVRHARKRIGGGRRPPPAPAAVYGALSLIFWALEVVVTIKYVVFIMRADNNGEGGVMALAALAHRAPVSRKAKTAIGIAALLGLALFYGDGMLTPAISVLSAMEGLSAGGRSFTPWIMPLTLIILVGLFLAQSPRHREDRQGVRAGDGAMVHHPGRAGRDRHRQIAADPARRRSALWPGALYQ